MQLSTTHNFIILPIGIMIMDFPLVSKKVYFKFCVGDTIKYVFKFSFTQCSREKYVFALNLNVKLETSK